MKVADALIFLDEALDALTLEGWRWEDWRGLQPIARIELTIADDLERIDAALGPRGGTMLSPMAAEVRRAVIALVAAKQALGATE